MLEQFLQGIPAVVAAVQALTYAFFVSSCVCALILWSGPRHLRLTARGHDRSDLQAIHRVPTPRVGGVAVFAGMITALFVLMVSVHQLLRWRFGGAATPSPGRSHRMDRLGPGPVRHRLPALGFR